MRMQWIPGLPSPSPLRRPGDEASKRYIISPVLVFLLGTRGGLGIGYTLVIISTCNCVNGYPHYPSLPDSKERDGQTHGNMWLQASIQLKGFNVCTIDGSITDSMIVARPKGPGCRTGYCWHCHSNMEVAYTPHNPWRHSLWLSASIWI